MFGWLKNLFYNWGGGPAKTANAVSSTILFCALAAFVVLAVITVVMWKIFHDVHQTKLLDEREERIKELENKIVEEEGKNQREIAEKKKDEELKILYDRLNKLDDKIDKMK